MTKADGSVIIDTRIDTGGVEIGFQKLAADAKMLGKGLLSVGKTATVAGAAITAALGAAVVSLSKKAVTAYADYEQLVGGVETLFKDSSDKVIQYAENAFYTSGVSANKYMEIVTGFSASLLSSLGNDTDKAADVANMALVDMSDNANKMGTALESIQNAYQGFAKQNYTMLDNLKLGYGGTKTEMERLLADAQKLTGQKYDISNLSDVYSAIHAIQTQLGITGTTAKEAEDTITGSANMTKAAWENVLAAISGGGDIDKAINNLVYSVSKYFDNIVPVVQRSIAGIGQLIEKIAPQLVQTVATALIQAIPSLLNAIYQMIMGLAKGIYQGIVALFSGGTAEGISAALNDVTQAADGAASATDGLAEATEEAGKTAKKSLASFDELNILADNSSGSSSTADTSGVSGGDISIPGIAIDQKETEAATTGVITAILDGLRTKLQEYANLFQPTIDAWSTAFEGFPESVSPAIETIETSFTNLKSETLAPFGEYVSTEFVPDISNTFSETFAPIFSDVATSAVTNFATDFENGCLVIDEALGWVETAMEDVKTVFTDMCNTIKEKWDEYGKPILDGISDFKEGVWETFWAIYDEIIKPVLGKCAEEFDKLWEDHLKPMWDNLTEFAMSLWENILTLWNEVLHPVIMWIISYFGPRISKVISGIVTVTMWLVGKISDAISTVVKILDGVITFVTGVFTLDFERAWNGIKKIFGGIWGGMVTSAKSAINVVIWAINKMISGIYTGIASVVNGIGSVVETVGKVLGHDWGFSVPTTAPKIPYLAKGAVLPANKPFLAMVGDQKHGTNIEAPLDTIKQAVAEVLAELNTGGDINISFTGDLAQLARVLKPAIDRENNRKGVNLAKVVTG